MILTLLLAIAASILIYWAFLLIIVSTEMEDRKIFWTQRILAFIALVGASVVLLT